MAQSDWNDWDNVDASREFLEKDYTGSEEAGSAMYQYCMDKGREAYRLRLVEHLSAYELYLYLEANGFTGGIHIAGDSTVIYPGYRHPKTIAASQARSAGPKDSEPKAESSPANRKPSARPGSNPGRTKSRPSKRKDITKPTGSISGITKPRPSKRQDIPAPKKRTKKAEKESVSDDSPGTTPRLRSLRPVRQRRRVKSEFFHPDERKLRS